MNIKIKGLVKSNLVKQSFKNKKLKNWQSRAML
jgi:hypothetical protein